jgi:hypothetical protein
MDIVALLFVNVSCIKYVSRKYLWQEEKSGVFATLAESATLALLPATFMFAVMLDAPNTFGGPPHLLPGSPPGS